MDWYFYLIGAITLVAAIALIIVVILQEGNSKGVGVVSGGADTFFGKSKGANNDKLLSTITAVASVIFAVVVIVMPFVI